ncbi:AAA family ATPase [Komagataeibacter europaeus]|uniref:AAA family ATPase n=1 Tax=Komagataeibacter europaeus TaxID=33995 RepID=UPI000B3E87E2|nr:AAA family ATPase [Komagataeibacter europaeus]ARW15784.1 hypothetical protein S101446_00644 [Komagataeibacter europaeus]
MPGNKNVKLLSPPTAASSSTYLRMKKIKIENFKAINSSEFYLSDFVVLVGTNGSGKSSVLQAIHWILQSCRNKKIEPNREKASTLSELDATYMPSPDYKNSSHTTEYGNTQNSPQMNVYFESEMDNKYFCFTKTYIKSARNEGISVHAPSKDSFILTIRSPSREASAYIPGLAGIPAFEEKRSKRIVQRHAASGDANTVLRNILLLLKEKKSKTHENSLVEIEYFISKIFGEINLDVSFSENDDYKIKANFQTKSMKDRDSKLYKPLELAGIGFLQVIQIFSYIVYFNPRVILIDEPDSHLHPDAQEKLVSVLFEASAVFDCQVIMTTHSPNVIRSLPLESSIIWMKNGKSSMDEHGDIRESMGWGLLDKKIILITEDKKTNMLNNIISQWPDIQNKCVVWPSMGSSKLPQPEMINSLRKLFGKKMDFIIHRDSDFFLEKDKSLYRESYSSRNLHVWFTQGSDIESYYINPIVVAKTYGISYQDAEDIINIAMRNLNDGSARTTFNRKRNEITNVISEYKNGRECLLGSDQAYKEISAQNETYVFVGKDLMSEIRKICQQRKLKGILGSLVPEGVGIAEDLKTIITRILRKR